MIYNLAVIGGGPAGYIAAEKAAKKGLSVILFEKDALGGVCLNKGCIPTKTLLHSAKLYEHALNSAKYGIETKETVFDIPKIIARKNKIIRKLNAGIRARLKEAGVETVSANAYIESKQDDIFNIKAGDIQYQSQNLIIATGSVSAIPPIPGIENIDVWSSTEALEAKELPKKLVIIGGGVIGMEFASYFNTFGTDVTVVEMTDEILPGIDSDISTALRDEYSKKGVKFMLDCKVESVEPGKLITSQGEVDFDRLLIAAGRKPNLNGFGLENLSPEYNGKNIKVDSHMETSVKGLYACGDVTGYSMLAHTAEREAAVAVNHISGIDDEMKYNAIPGVIYTNPEVACVGMTEKELNNSEIKYKSKKLPMTFAGRFVVENEAFNGLCKLFISENDEILGTHILGSPASELIIAPVMAISHNIPASEWLKSVFPHPTVSEIFKECL